MSRGDRAAHVAAAVVLAAAGLLAPRHGAPPRSVVRVSAGAESATGLATAERVTTVAHVLAGGSPVLAGGVPARVQRLDADRDVAVLAAPGLRPAPAPAVGGVALLVRRGGRAVALPVRVRRRVTAHLRGSARAALELDAAIEPGDSGAPVVAPGRLLGIVFARSTERAGTAYATDLGAALR
jgi:S1-C subfamily serine protease